MQGCRTTAHHLFRSNTSSHLSVRSVSPSKFLSARIFGSSLATGLLQRCASPRRPLSRTCSGQSQHIGRVRCACSVGERSEQKERYTLPAHTLAFGCIDASHISTGYEPKARISGSPRSYEPKDARTEESVENQESKARYNVSPTTWEDSACWEQLHAQDRSSRRESAVPNVSKKDVVSSRTCDSSILGKGKRLLAETLCEYIDIRSRRQGVCLV